MIIQTTANPGCLMSASPSLSGRNSRGTEDRSLSMDTRTNTKASKELASRDAWGYLRKDGGLVAELRGQCASLREEKKRKVEDVRPPAAGVTSYSLSWPWSPSSTFCVVTNQCGHHTYHQHHHHNRPHPISLSFSLRFPQPTSSYTTSLKVIVASMSSWSSRHCFLFTPMLPVTRIAVDVFMLLMDSFIFSRRRWRLRAMARRSTDVD